MLEDQCFNTWLDSHMFHDILKDMYVFILYIVIHMPMNNM